MLCYNNLTTLSNYKACLFYLGPTSKIIKSFFNYFCLTKSQSTRSQCWRRGTKCDCKRDWLRVRLKEMKYLFYINISSLWSSKLSAALSSATQDAMSQILTLSSLCRPCRQFFLNRINIL